MGAPTPSSGVNSPPPITIFNFPTYVGNLLAAVATMQSDVTQSLANQAVLNSNQQNALINIAAIAANVTEIGNVVNNLVGAIQNTVNLLEVVINAMAPIATQAEQQQLLTIVNKILAIISASFPVTQDIDLTKVIATPTIPPKQPGPIPTGPTPKE